MNLQLPSPELYNMIMDPGENSDCAPSNPDLIGSINHRVAQLLPTFPSDVQNAWRTTMQIPVEYSPTGALPIKQT
jgi:hypothetical protein